ncbi:MAG TPA: hypothetical protein VN771_06590 [Candidatus Baltobacteraceae bacterium]|nr:hypothetical protein [Candidatus Baltobacteraceae bacterium]
MPDTVEFMISLGVALALLAVLGAVAQRWGVDSRGLDSPTQERWFGGR